MKGFIEEKQFYLRGIEEYDLAHMKDWPSNPEITNLMVMGCVPNGGPIYCSWDRIEEEYERMKKSNNDVIFAIVSRETDKVIGLVGLYGINWIARNAEFRIVIGETDFLGKGIGTRVTRTVVKYAFEKLNLHKVYLGVNAEDERANKCYKRAGFVHEGTQRDYNFRNGRYYHANLYSILEGEFKCTK